MIDWIMALNGWEWLLFAVLGILTGVINTLAGSGSLITLPIFIDFCGLSATVANGTNRIGALLQSAWGARAFWHSNPAAFQHSEWVILPSIAGSFIGAAVSLVTPEAWFKGAIAGLMVFMFVVLLVNPTRWIRDSTQELAKMRTWRSGLTFLAIGFYGGFIQAGVGIFLLAGLVLSAGYNLRDANAIKLTIVTALSIPAIMIFALSQNLHYGLGLTMAFFQVIGAAWGVQLSARIPNINVWIHRLMIVMVGALAIHMIWGLVQ